MKKNPKSKSSPANVSVPSRSKSDLAGFMAKVQEQLAFLGSKIDALMGQAPAKPSEIKGPHVTMRQADRAKFITQPGSPSLPAEVSQTRGPARGRGRERRERILHKAVCADCHKDCEIPFKPSGERPVYCKECFSKRKAGSSPKASHENKQMARPEAVERPRHEREVPPPAAPAPQRRVTVTKKGVGKVVISEVVAPATRDIPPRGKEDRPAGRPRR